MHQLSLAEHMAKFSDEALVRECLLTRSEFQEASMMCPNSEWHVACFAAFLCYAEEAVKRGLPLKKY